MADIACHPEGARAVLCAGLNGQRHRDRRDEPFDVGGGGRVQGGGARNAGAGGTAPYGAGAGRGGHPGLEESARDPGDEAKQKSQPEGPADGAVEGQGVPAQCDDGVFVGRYREHAGQFLYGVSAQGHAGELFVYQPDRSSQRRSAAADDAGVAENFFKEELAQAPGSGDDAVCAALCAAGVCEQGADGAVPDRDDLVVRVFSGDQSGVHVRGLYQYAQGKPDAVCGVLFDPCQYGRAGRGHAVAVFRNTAGGDTRDAAESGDG